MAQPYSTNQFDYPGRHPQQTSSQAPPLQPPQQASPQPLHYPTPTDAGSARPAISDSWSDNESADGDDKDGSKKRKRPMSVSCELCKSRKVKCCDRGQPTCGWCARNGQSCEYKERKKPGLRAGYGRELESRLDRLEAVCRSHQIALAQLTNGAIPPVEAPGAQSPHDANMFAQSPAFATPSIPRSDPSSAQQTTPQSTGVQDFRSGYTSFSNGGYQQAQQGGYQQPPSARYHRPEAQMMQQAPDQSFYPGPDGPVPLPALTIPAVPSAAASQDQDLPPYDLLYSLADLYFKHINTWCPILHRKTTLDALFGPSSLDEADRILLHAIVATTLRFSEDPRLEPENKSKYHAVSKQKVMLYGLENSSVKALQALVILALDLCGTSNGPPGWNLLALITRSAVQLGLSIEATSASISPRVPSIYTLRAMVLPDPNSWIEDESRRRLFWMIYVLDRYATIQTAFEFALDEKEIDRRLPCRDDSFTRNQAVETRWFRNSERADKTNDKPELLGSFSYYVELIGILSRIHQFLKKAVDIAAPEDVERWQREYRELDNTLNVWKNNLPREYGNVNRLFDSSTGNKVVNCGWVMLHATYHTTVIRLHSSAAYPARRSPIFAPSYNATQQCSNAVDAISNLCAHVKSNNMLSKLGPPFAFSVWVASRVVLVHSSTIDHQINPTIHFFVNTLSELGEYWGVAKRYATLLQRVLEEYNESERAAASVPNGGRQTPSSVRILADMRRCAFDLDFLISRQPRLHLTNGSDGIPPTIQTGAGAMGAFTPARTPAPNELEYLDVFDFFNMPRLPMSAVGMVNGSHLGAPDPEIQTFGGSMHIPRGQGVEFNPASFTADASTDWFMKSEPQ